MSESPYERSEAVPGADEATGVSRTQADTDTDPRTESGRGAGAGTAAAEAEAVADAAEEPGSDPAPGPSPLGLDPGTTGNAQVDTVLQRLSDADELRTHDHVAVYEDVHGALRDVLAALDARPSQGPPPPAAQVERASPVHPASPAPPVPAPPPSVRNRS